MKIHIPNSAFLGNINVFFSNLDLKNKDYLEITANPNWISIHPVVLSMIAVIGKTVSPNNIKCEEITARSGHYLVTMGLFDFLGIKVNIKNIEKHETSGVLIPLKQIRNSKDLQTFLEELVPLLHLQNNPSQAESIQHIFSELIRNVLEHAYSEHGAVVCAQYFKTSNRISIGVADVGVGLKTSIRKSYSVMDDISAIKLALTPGVTGTTIRPGGTAQNAGFGLFLIKSIAFVNANYFTIISGDKMYKLLKRSNNEDSFKLKSNPLEDRHSISDVPSWDGVVVGVDISLNENKAFSQLLGIIRDFYAKNVTGLKKEKYKKPKFI